jgi:uncharacterized protein (DUF2147 family)
MKFLMFLCLLFTFGITQPSIIGKWKTIDDNTGKETSIVEISERDGKVYGKVIKIFPNPGDEPDPLCDKCPEDDARYKKKIIGMEIIKDMVKLENALDNGNILDPAAGKIYDCKIWLEGNDLKVRGYWGPFFRTQTWKKVSP